MSQKIFFNFQEGLSSFNMGQQYNGILWPGRYCGFDTKGFSGMVLSLTHAASGIIQTDIAGAQTAHTGAYMSRQGSIVQENSTVSIGTISANSSGNPRIDLIVGQYLKPTAASTPATYLVVTGTPGSTPAVPSLPNPEKQVILGQLLVPTGTTSDLSTCTYTPSLIPLLGNETRPNPIYSQDYSATMAGSWSASDGSTLFTSMPLRKNLITQNSFSFLEGAAITPGAFGIILTLPAALWPEQDYYIPVITTNNITGGGTASANTLKIDTAGVVTIANSCSFVHLRNLVINLY